MTIDQYFGYLRALLEAMGVWSYLSLFVQAGLILAGVVWLIKTFRQG